MQLTLPPQVAHLADLGKLCRATVLILADRGVIHPGPTIYDSFWVRDSSVEGVSAALAGDVGLAATQFGEHYPRVFNLGFELSGKVSLHGFFGAEHEKQDREWDSNGQALWAFGRFDRIQGPTTAFGARMFQPYVVDGARWIRDNRSQYGLLHSGWSAEHLGDKDKPHYGDNFWGIAGLYEASRLAERIDAPERAELWAAYEDLREAMAASIRWVLDRQRASGRWETFIPTGPGDVDRLDFTMIGTVAYFHPCRLYQGQKLESDVDAAARWTLDTIWAHFVDDGGFRHDSAWHAYGPYLGLQLAHAFLFVGDIPRMDACLRWAFGEAAFPAGPPLDAAPPWQIVSGAWNEQHAYPVAEDFARRPEGWWYMGDIPHGWASAEFQLLLRDICFFEAAEDDDPHVYLTPGVPPHWLIDGTEVRVYDAPTAFGVPFGFVVTCDRTARTVTIEVHQQLPANVRFVYPCRLGRPARLVVDGLEQPVPPGAGPDVDLPARMRRAVITYV